MATSFFKINQQGIIQNVYFDDAKLIDKYTRSFFGIFNSETNERLMNSSEIKEQIFTRFENLKKQSDELIAFSSQNAIYMYYSDRPLPEMTLEEIKRFIKIVPESQIDDPNVAKLDSHLFYENIQKLNNELINKSRQIEKMNQELNHLNSILNDRLVKDPLTNLVSRYQYRDEILSVIHQNPDSNGLFCFIDLDNFKLINDTYGHDVGDQYLVEFANRLMQISMSNVIKIRIAGDEFGLFIYPLKDNSKAYSGSLWDLFQTEIIAPIVINNIKLPLAFSMGISRYPQNSKQIHVLIDQADQAMYKAKNSGKNRFEIF